MVVTPLPKISVLRNLTGGLNERLGLVKTRPGTRPPKGFLR